MDAEAVYQADEWEGTIVRFPTAGGAPTVIASRQGEPSGLAVDERHAFWVASATERLRRAPKLGGAFGGLATDTKGPARIAVDDTSAFVARSRLEKRDDEAILVRVPKDGGNLTALLRGEPSRKPAAIALDADHVYLALAVTPEREYTEKGTLLRVAKTGGEPETLAADMAPPHSMVLDGDFLYFTAATSLKEGEIARMPKSGGARQTLYKSTSAAPLAVALDATHLFFTDSAGAVWRMPRDGGEPHELSELPDGRDTGSELAISESALWVCGDRGLFELSWSPLQEAPDVLAARGSAAHALVMDGRGHLIGADFVGRARVFDLATGRTLQEMGQDPGREHHVRDLGLGAGGQVLVIADEEGAVEGWDLASGSRKWAASTPGVRSSETEAFAMSPDGSVLLLLRAGQPVRVLSAETGKELHTFADPTEQLGAAAISPDNRFWLAAAKPYHSHKHPREPKDEVLRMWELSTGKPLGSFRGEPEWVSAVAITADGKRAVTAGESGLLRVWDIASRAAVITLRTKGLLADVALSRSGERALTTSSVEGTCLWDLAAQKQIACIPPRDRRAALIYWPGRVIFSPSEKEAWRSTTHGYARWKLPE
jgi:WD40 repeat protein